MQRNSEKHLMFGHLLLKLVDDRHNNNNNNIYLKSNIQCT